MDIMLWILIALCFSAGLVGIVLPILPSVALVWAGVGIFHFFIDAQLLSWVTWGTIIDQLSSVLVVKRYGANKLSTFAKGLMQLIMVGPSLLMFSW